MGNNSSTNTSFDSPDSESINKNSFEYISIIGRGGFGKVWKVESKKLNKLYAMKAMSKIKIIDKKSEKSIKSERNLLSKMNHPFIINMHYSFQDKETLYLIMDLLTGGDIRYHICKKRKFTESQTKFFIACIILGLEYCHSNFIIHRDIKPENLVLDDKGYVKITDFGIAKIQATNNSKETSGTPGYMAPEVMCCQNHTVVVDYFALGVMGYEFMKGVRPYLGRSRKEIKEKIMAKQINIKKYDIPEGWSTEAADCINRLLQRKPFQRLGYHGINDIKNHSWFIDFPWRDLYYKKLEAPFIPEGIDNFDSKYCNQVEKIGVQTQERYNEIMGREDFSEIFNDYYYFNAEVVRRNLDYQMYINPHEEYFNKKSENIHSRNNLNFLGMSHTASNNKNFDIHYYHNSYDIKISQLQAFSDANNYIRKRNNSKKNTRASTNSGQGTNGNNSLHTVVNSHSSGPRYK